MTYPPKSDAVPLSESLRPTAAPPERPRPPRAVTGLVAVLVALHLIELAVWLVATAAVADGLGLERLIVGGMAETALAVGFGVAAGLVAARRSAGRLLVFTLSGLVWVRGLAHLISVALTVAGFSIDWDPQRYLSTSLTLVAAAVTVMVVVLLTREPAAQLPEWRDEQSTPDPRRPGSVIAAGAALGCVAALAALAAVSEAVELLTGGRHPDSYVSHLSSLAALFAGLAVGYLAAAALLVLGRESGRVLALACAGYLVWLGVQGLASPAYQLLLGLVAAAIGVALIWVVAGRRTAAWLDARRAPLR